MKTFVNFDTKDIQDLLEHKSKLYFEESPDAYIKASMRKRREKNYEGEGAEVSIIILSKDNLPYLRVCLASIERAGTELATEIIIVSNAQEEATKKYLNSCGYTVYYKTDDFNFAEYNNFGAKQATGKYLVFLNDDTVVTAGWLDVLIKPLRDDTTIGITGAKILSQDGVLQHMGIAVNLPGNAFADHMFAGNSPDIPQANEYRYVGAVSGVCMAMEKYTLELLNGFDSSFGAGYFEDLDLCLRLPEVAAQDVLYVPEALVFHFGSITFNRVTNHANTFSVAHNRFREKWQEDIENTSIRFKSHRFLYKSKRKKVIIRNSYMSTAGGGEYLTLALAEVLKPYYNVEIQTATLNGAVLAKLKNTLQSNLGGINFELLNPNTHCDVFINLEYGSSFGSQNADYGIYYTMFPHAVTNHNFIASYDKIVGISEYSSSFVWDYWRRKAETIYPSVEYIGYDSKKGKESLILSVGRFFTGGHKKNQDLLVKVFNQAKIEGCRLVLVGNNQDLDSDRAFIDTLKRYINLHNVNAEILLGISRDELRDLYRKAAVYWHAAGFGANQPLEYEHFGISVVEAMSAGCIPVVYDGGGIRETTAGVADRFRWSEVPDMIQKTKNALSIANTEDGYAIQEELMQRSNNYSFKTFSNKWIELLSNEHLL